MLKKFVQQGRSEGRGEAYPLGYVEPLSDARTMLADFFSIRLIEHHGFSAIHQYSSLDVAAHGAGQHNLFQIPTLSH